MTHSKKSPKLSFAPKLTREETATRLRISVRTLDRIRVLGLGPEYLDLSLGHGKKPIIRYREADIEAFEEKARIPSVRKIMLEAKN